jgi:predicted amidophosphoribosyltransferase
VQQSSQCGVCRKDWGKTGPMCRHCRLETEFKIYERLLHTFRKQGNTAPGGKDQLSNRGRVKW